MKGAHAACLDEAEARAALRALAWFIREGSGALLGEDGAALLAAREKLAAALRSRP